MPTRSPQFKAAVQFRPRSPDYDDQRATSAERGYDNRWTKLRRYKLNQTPLCERCAQIGKVTAATMVHHVQPIEARPDLRLSHTNLQSVCYPCHQRIHNDDDIMRPASLVASLSPLSLVCGPPCSGKSYYVASHMQPSDLVIDLDVIASKIARTSLHMWTKDVLRKAIITRNRKLSRINDSAHDHVWFLLSEPLGDRRHWWATKLGAVETIVMLTPPDVCIARAKQDDGRMLDITERAIKGWWSRYTPWCSDIDGSPKVGMNASSGFHAYWAGRSTQA